MEPGGEPRCRREFAIQLGKAVDSGTTMADARDDLLYMPAARGGITSNDREDILHMVGAFPDLQAHALSTDDSREFLWRAVVRWS